GLKRQYDPRTILFEPLAPDADLTPIRTIRDVERVEAAGDAYRITLTTGVDPAAVVRAVAAAVAPARIELARLRLEDVFIRLVAVREFTAAISNKGFVIGLLLMPVMSAMLGVAVPRLMRAQTAPARGQVAVIDVTGVTLPELRLAIAPAAFSRRRAETTSR